MPMPDSEKVQAAWAAVTKKIEGQASTSGRRVAIKSDSAELTHSQLEAQANQLAHHLRTLGAQKEVLIGICLERSPRFISTALAILKSGAAYLPIDPRDPAERLKFIARDAAVKLIITDRQFAELFEGSGAKVVSLDAEQSTVAQCSTEALETDIRPEDLAYVIYTSGSTGQPKGVEITHRNLANLVAWHVRAFHVDVSTRATFQAGVGFDAAVWEIWPHLSAGATIYLPGESTRMDAAALRDWLVSNQITLSFVPTAIAEQLLGLTWPEKASLKFLLTGADTLHRFPPPDLPFAFLNNYGPTECTVVTTSGIIPPCSKPDGLPSIGAPIENVHVRIVDKQLREVPDGDSGEIWIGGAGVGRGYRNRPELMAEKFIDNSGSRFYRTGDLGRRLPNGEIAFLGRVDDQVKIRGYRVELGEINAVLNEHPTVRASVVIPREDVPGEKRLVAYVVSASCGGRDQQCLREWIRERLPDYMEPAAFVWMESLPLTSNGKIDRAALPVPQLDANENEREFVAARNPIEEALVEIIGDVLKVPRVSVHDDFFQLGAHSLLGAQIVAHVRNVFGAELKLLDVFDAPTVAQLSVRVERALTNQTNGNSETQPAHAALN